MTTATAKLSALFGGGRIWAWVPVLLLGGLLGAQLTVLHYVLEDPGFALESDYYRKAVSWDAQRELDRESAALSWQAQLAATASERGTQLHLELKDAGGAALSGAGVRLQAFANARAARQFEVTLAERAPGLYQGELLSAADGLWEFRLQATRGSARFAKIVRLSVERGSP
ncbi:MAG TPA: FixH family protein [Polyangiaceae bacterium]|jgi:nitrogen fixation protein FixH|nr:FixH family protein [Polyangiaceae bacterium]